MQIQILFVWCSASAKKKYLFALPNKKLNILDKSRCQSIVMMSDFISHTDHMILRTFREIELGADEASIGP